MNHLRGRGAHRWQAAAAMVPTAPPSNRVASTNDCTGMRPKWSLNTSVNSRGTPARRATTYRTVLAAAAINAATRPTCQSGRLVHAGLVGARPPPGAVVSRLGARDGLLGVSCGAAYRPAGIASMVAAGEPACGCRTTSLRDREYTSQDGPSRADPQTPLPVHRGDGRRQGR